MKGFLSHLHICKKAIINVSYHFQALFLELIKYLFFKGIHQGWDYIRMSICQLKCYLPFLHCIFSFLINVKVIAPVIWGRGSKEVDGGVCVL